MNRAEEIKHIKDWLANRPSATMDPCLDERVRKVNRLHELTSRQRITERLPTKMMEAQEQKN